MPSKNYRDYCTRHFVNNGYDITFTDYNEIPLIICSQSPKQNAMNSIKKVIFNDPATIVLWSDGTKTVVKCDERDEFDPEKGLAMAICKKHFGGGFYNDIFKKWIPEKKDDQIEGQISMTEIAEKLEAFAKKAKSVFGPWNE